MNKYLLIVNKRYITNCKADNIKQAVEKFNKNHYKEDNIQSFWYDVHKRIWICYTKNNVPMYIRKD